jgi:hypothetical protein
MRLGFSWLAIAGVCVSANAHLLFLCFFERETEQSSREFSGLDRSLVFPQQLTRLQQEVKEIFLIGIRRVLFPLRPKEIHGDLGLDDRLLQVRGQCCIIFPCHIATSPEDSRSRLVSASR